jgi:hypothetical protein
MLTDQWVTWDFPTQRAGPFRSEKETAALAGPQSGGEWTIEALRKPLTAQCRNGDCVQLDPARGRAERA